MKIFSTTLVLMLLTACSSDEPMPEPAATVPPLAPATTTPNRPASEKLQAKAAAGQLLDVMRSLAGVVDNPVVMQEDVNYGRYFYKPLESELLDWPVMSDTRFEMYGDLNYCREAARHLSQLGERLHSKEFGQQFVDSARASFQQALPKCEQAIKTYR